MNPRNASVDRRSHETTVSVFLDLDGNSRGSNPVRGTVTVDLDGTPVEVTVTEVVDGRARLVVDLGSAATATVTDSYGNVGSLSL